MPPPRHGPHIASSNRRKVSARQFRRLLSMIALAVVLSVSLVNFLWDEDSNTDSTFYNFGGFTMSNRRQLRISTIDVGRLLRTSVKQSEDRTQQLLLARRGVQPRQYDNQPNITATLAQPLDHERARAFRILYIMTSSSKSVYVSNNNNTKHGPKEDQKRNRWSEMIVPILQHNVESFYQQSAEPSAPQKRNYQVDVYLITSYTVNKTEVDMLWHALPMHTGVQIWQDAAPLSYHCQEFHNEPAGNGERCQYFNTSDRYRGKMEYNFTQSRIRQAMAQLSRQHRYVVKDKLPYYDFFVILEDDMIVTKVHVEHHCNIMQRIKAMQDERLHTYSLPEEAQMEEKHKHNSHANNTTQRHPNPSWNVELTDDYWRRMRPGFVRVEVRDSRQDLQKDMTSAKTYTNSTQKGTPSIPFDNQAAASPIIDPRICCDIPTHIKTASISNTHPSTEDIVLWETNTAGFKIRPWHTLEYERSNGVTGGNSSASWMAATVSGTRGFPGYWTGRYMSPQPRRPGKSDPKYMAQSAGWMGSSQEIMEYQTKLCAPQETHRSKGKGVSGPFLPPFDAPLYKRDGLWRNNVEFWSGGIQLWGGMCQIQRVFNLDNSNDFSKHLIYHASNNKQHKIDQGRLMQAQMLWTELHLIKMQLEQEFYHTK